MLRRKSKKAGAMADVAEAADVAEKKAARGKKMRRGSKKKNVEPAFDEDYAEDLTEDLSQSSAVVFDDPSVSADDSAEEEHESRHHSRGGRRRRHHEEEEEEKVEESAAEEEPKVNIFGDSNLDDDFDLGGFGSMDLGAINDDGGISSEEEDAIENNAEMEILDFFKVDHNKHHMDVDEEEAVSDIFEEPEEEEPEEEVPEPTPVIEEDNIIGALKRATEIIYDKVTKRILKANDVEVIYDNKSVPSVERGEDVLLLANHRIYTTETRDNWDELFEVKAKNGSTIEVETGVALIIPDGYLLELSISDKSREKYSIEFETMLLDGVEAAKPIIVKLQALEGAYLSRIGRVIECRLVKK